MPPKRSDLHHVTFHFYRSAILLSIPATTTLSSIKSQLIPALQPLSSTLPISLPQTSDDIRLYEDRSLVEGEETRSAGDLRCIEEDDKAVMSRTIKGLGWPRWKKIYVRGEDGRFGEPIYTIPDPEDEEADGNEE